MDHTISSKHCGPGLLRSDLDNYIQGCSQDFVSYACALAKAGFHQAVATGSDPKEYTLPGQSKESHILGPDLARAVMEAKCPDVIDCFQIMIGFDCRLHPDLELEKGKRRHMRLISEFYNVPQNKMILIDDSKSSLENESGYHGLLVQNRDVGFSKHDASSYIKKMESTGT
eukprot:m.343875 g.343875  ORF g.343875 m.343875 type:complete len:171 (-) comp23461_c0_seq1:165-677(-)